MTTSAAPPSSSPTTSARAGSSTSRSHPPRGHPIVYADWLHAEGAPTVLVYAHYDVQPVDPLDLWVRPPFEPRVENGRVYARGAADDKGQVHLHLWAARAWLETAGTAAGQSSVRLRGRGGVRLGQLRRVDRGQPRSPEGRSRGRQRHGLLRGQPAGDDGRPARPDVCPDRRDRARPSTSTRARTAATSRTRPSRWRRSWPGSRTTTASVNVPGFYDEVRPLTRGGPRRVRAAAARRGSLPRAPRCPGAVR